MYKIYKTFRGKILNPEKPSDFCWIDLNSPTEEDILELKSLVEIPEDVIASIKDVDEVPKLEKYDDFHFILFQTPRINTEEEEEDSVSGDYSVAPLGVIYTSEYLITISDGRNDVMNYLRLKLKNYLKNKIINTEKIPQFILKLLLFTSKIYLRYLKVINQKIRLAQGHLEQTQSNTEIVHLMDLEKSLVYFSTSLHSNQIVIEKLSKRKIFTSEEENEELLEDILDENKQAIETAKVYGRIISNVSNTFASIISNNLNQTLKFLTSVTIILMIPTLIASIYGMNVELPFQQSPHAFNIVMVISVLFSLVGVVIFFRKKFF